jgi:hypothetical protein
LSGPFWPIEARVRVGRDVGCILEFADFHLVAVDESADFAAVRRKNMAKI